MASTFIQQLEAALCDPACSRGIGRGKVVVNREALVTLLRRFADVDLELRVIVPQLRKEAQMLGKLREMRGIIDNLFHEVINGTPDSPRTQG